MKPRRTFIGAFAAAALTVSLTAIPAQAAPAVDCDLGTPINGNYDDIDTTVDSTPARTGPYQACRQVATIPANSSLYVLCYVTNSYGNTWSYEWLRGFWVYDAHYLDGGAGTRCVF
jgi:hypothetical protein